LDAVIGWLEKRTDWVDRQFILAPVLAAIAITIACPTYKRFGPFAEHSPWAAQALNWQTQHLLEPIPVERFAVGALPGGEGVMQYLRKRSYRVTVPILSHYTGLSLKGFVGLEQFTSCLFLLFAYQIFLKIFKDRLTAFLAAVATAGSFVGQWGFYGFDTFDGLAYFVMMLILRAKRPWAIPLLVVAAGFIDDRAIIAMPMLYLFQENSANLSSGQWTLSPNPLRIAILVGIICFGVLRIALGIHMGRMFDFSGTLTQWFLVHNLLIFEISLLALFKGISLLIGTSVLVIAKKRAFRNAFLLVASATCSVLAALYVADLSRSLCYIFPCIFLCARIVAQELDVTALRRLCLCAAIVSISMPTYYFLYVLNPLLPILRLF
jgi:hypothetical protein